MPEIKTAMVRGTFVCLLICLASFFVSAQSTIFNVPSTDVVGEDLFYVEADFISHLDKWNKGGFQTYGYRTVYGVRKKLEVGVNFFYTRNGVNSPKELQPNFKYKVFEKEKYGLAVSTGAQFFVPLNKSAGRRAYGLFYSNASKTIKRTRDTRITGGFYALVGAPRGFGTKQGAIVGIEQPVVGKLRLTADWFSGKNRFGYSSAGLSYSFTKRQTLQLGYNFGNSGRGNNSLAVYYGFVY